MRGEGVEGRRQVVAWHAPPAFDPRGKGKQRRGGGKSGEKGVFSKRLSHNGTVRVTSFLTSCQVAWLTAASVLLCRRQLDVAATLHDRCCERRGWRHRHKAPSSLPRCPPVIIPPDDRTSTV